jgi:hypothetical protein
VRPNPKQHCREPSRPATLQGTFSPKQQLREPSHPATLQGTLSPSNKRMGGPCLAFETWEATNPDQQPLGPTRVSKARPGPPIHKRSPLRSIRARTLTLRQSIHQRGNPRGDKHPRELVPVEEREAEERRRGTGVEYREQKPQRGQQQQPIPMRAPLAFAGIRHTQNYRAIPSPFLPTSKLNL